MRCQLQHGCVVKLGMFTILEDGELTYDEVYKLP
jgi:hypothetical protein